MNLDVRGSLLPLCVCVCGVYVSICVCARVCTYACFLQYKLLLYSLDGRLLSTYSAYEWSLGIKSIAWSPSSQFLAVGSYDEKVINAALHYL